MTLQEWINEGANRLSPIYLGDCKEHLFQICRKFLGASPHELAFRWNETLSTEEISRLNSVLLQRLSGQPLQYITGEAFFWKSSFKVGPGVLIPRSDTETIVECMLRNEERSRIKVAELGPGSGNIGISALQERPTWEWHAFELDPNSLPFLRSNATGTKLQIHEGDFFQEAGRFAPFDWVVSNPPYIDENDLTSLPPDIQKEPKLALDGGDDGIEILLRLAEHSTHLLKPSGQILFELDPGQKEAVQSQLETLGFKQIELAYDLAHKIRGINAKWMP